MLFPKKTKLLRTKIIRTKIKRIVKNVILVHVGQIPSYKTFLYLNTIQILNIKIVGMKDLQIHGRTEKSIDKFLHSSLNLYQKANN